MEKPRIFIGFRGLQKTGRINHALDVHRPEKGNRKRNLSEKVLWGRRAAGPLYSKI